MNDPLPKPLMSLVVEALGGEVVSPDRGGWRKARCIFHDDRTASASINDDACRYRCHSCDFSGDAIDLIGAFDNAGFAAARKRAEEFLAEGGGDVRAERGSSSLLPGSKRNKPRGGYRVQPWMRF